MFVGASLLLADRVSKAQEVWQETIPTKLSCYVVFVTISFGTTFFIFWIGSLVSFSGFSFAFFVWRLFFLDQDGCFGGILNY